MTPQDKEIFYVFINYRRGSLPRRFLRVSIAPRRSSRPTSSGAGTSSSSLLEENLQVSRGVQLALTPSEEEVMNSARSNI